MDRAGPPPKDKVEALKAVAKNAGVNKTQLQSLCSINGLPKTGNKPDLVKRLIDGEYLPYLHPSTKESQECRLTQEVLLNPDQLSSNALRAATASVSIHSTAVSRQPCPGSIPTCLTRVCWNNQASHHHRRYRKPQSTHPFQVKPTLQTAMPWLPTACPAAPTTRPRASVDHLTGITNNGTISSSSPAFSTRSSTESGRSKSVNVCQVSQYRSASGHNR